MIIIETKKDAEVNKALEWTSITEKEPPYGKLVEVKYDNGHITTDFFLSNGSWGFFNNPDAVITQWREIPEVHL